MLIFQKMLTVFLLMAIGFIFGRKNWINDDNSGLLSKIVINVANPGMIIAAGLSRDSSLSNELLIHTFVMAVLFYIALLATAPLIMRLMRIPASMRGTYQYMYVFGNIGFMGMPLIVAVYGSESALLVALFNFVFTLLMYTYGIAVVRKEAAVNAGTCGTITSSGTRSGVDEAVGDATAETAGIHAKAAAGDTGKGRIRAAAGNIINIGTISSILALTFFLTQIQVPDFLYDTFEMMSNLACPLSMFVIGASLSKIAPVKLISDLRLNAFILVRLIVIPVLGIALVRYLVHPEDLLMRVFYVMISVPFASTSVMIAQEYGGQKGIASQGVALSTLVSVLTIPLLGMIFGF